MICCNLPKIQRKRPNLKVFCQKHANGIANSADPDQTAPLSVRKFRIIMVSPGPQHGKAIKNGNCVALGFIG